MLRTFLADGIKDNPAKHYALVISDHGASWPGAGVDEGADNDLLTLAELHEAIEGGLADAGLDRLDLLGFDACLMASYEVETALAPLADRMVGSSELEPGHGWNYAAYQSVADDRDASADDLGTAIVDRFMEQAQEERTSTYVTLALIDLTKMTAVDRALAAFTTALVAGATDLAPAVGRVRPSSQSYGRSPDPSYDMWMTDLGDLATKIGDSAPDVAGQSVALQKAIDHAVVHKVAGGAQKAFSGISVYFPPQEYFSDGYSAIETPSGWSKFLSTYYEAGNAIPDAARPAFTSDVTAPIFDDSGITLTGTLDPDTIGNVSLATIEYGLLDPATHAVTYLGEAPADVAADGTVSASYDLKTLKVSDGTDVVDAYLWLTDAADVASRDTVTLSVPVAYYAADDVNGETYQEVLLVLTMDRGTGEVIKGTYYLYNDQLGSYGELAADPDGTISPELQVLDDDDNETWVETSEEGLPADLEKLHFSIEPIASGTPFYVELNAYDFGGHDAFTYAEINVP